LNKAADPNKQPAGISILARQPLGFSLVDLCPHELWRVRIEGAFFSKEILQDRCAFILEDAGSDFAIVVQRRMPKQIYHSPCRAALQIGAAENEPAKANMDECAGAHYARFLGNV